MTATRSPARLVRRTVAVIACLLVVAGPGGSLATARSIQDDGATSEAATSSEAPSWAVEPSSATGPTGRAAFVYDVEPGQVVDDVLGISNFADEPQTFRVYGTDAFSTEDGSFALLTADEEASDIGSWVSFGAESYTVPPKSRLDLPFKVRVPANATPGDHAGGVVAAVLEEGDESDGQRVDIDRRVASRIYLRVQGPLTSELTIEQVSIDFDNPTNAISGGPMVVTYRVRNTGNTRLTGTARVSASGPAGLLRASAPASSLPELLPGAVITRTATIDGVRPTFRVTAEVEIAPEPVGGVTGTAPATVAASEATWAVPWLLLLVIAVALMARRMIRRRRRRRLASGPAEAPNPHDADTEADGSADVDAPVGAAAVP